jgi:molybdenum cofactor synthesis domain-containing protein
MRPDPGLAIAVITVSDRAYAGEYADLSGPKITGIITERFPQARLSLTVVPDEERLIRQALEERIRQGCDYIFTTGGTGISPRDVTPEVTRALCERDLPGVAELLRRESYRETAYAVFSRGYCGVKGNTIIVNFPGSVKGVSLCTRLLLPLLEHGVKMLRGEGH